MQLLIKVSFSTERNPKEAAVPGGRRVGCPQGAGDEFPAVLGLEASLGKAWLWWAGALLVGLMLTCRAAETLLGFARSWCGVGGFLMEIP